MQTAHLPPSRFNAVSTPWALVTDALYIEHILIPLDNIIDEAERLSPNFALQGRK